MSITQHDCGWFEESAFTPHPPTQSRMSNSSGPATARDDLPQSDGTCDACEPDEAQPAEQLCRLCGFAFCSVHASQHQRSMQHVLEPYAPPMVDGASMEAGANMEAGASGGSPEDGPPEGGGRHRDPVTVERLRCKLHGHEGSLYCKPDEKVICVVCAVQGEHQDHEIITLREAYLWQRVSTSTPALPANMYYSVNIY